MQAPAAVMVDVGFRLQGRSVPADHGYSLFGAISRVLPDLHGDERIGIHPLRGTHAPNRTLTLLPGARLRVRLPADRIAAILPLAGAELDVDGARLLVGVPEVHPLRPVASLQSHLVTIKGFTEPEPFLEAARRQLDALGIAGTLGIPLARRATSIEGHTSRPIGAPLRRTLAIHGRQVVGFPLQVSGLTADESIRLQESGLGGRRRFGCGIFAPL